VSVIKTNIDLRAGFGPVRDQGARPTCLAFAASDAHAALRDPWRPLSCEFAFYHAQRRAGRPPSAGTTLSAMLMALKHDGQPLEIEWPYLDKLPDDVDDYGPPSVTTLFRRDGWARPDGFGEIVAYLRAGQPSVVLMTISDAFYFPDGNGIIAFANEAPDPTRRHAVVAVGYGLVAKEDAILVRNSWGPYWGLGGHAWLTQSFLTPRIKRLAVLTENVHVPAPNIAA
jgi:hypothetical protein